MRNIIAKLLIILIFSSLFTIISSCKKEDRIPYVYFYERVYLDLPANQDLKIPGNFKYMPADRFGYAGVILYCLNTDRYLAYERNCPYKASEKDAILDVDSTNLFIVCRHCKSKFSILDGAKLEGPSKYSLKVYNTLLENSILSVYSDY